MDGEHVLHHYYSYNAAAVEAVEKSRVSIGEGAAWDRCGLCMGQGVGWKSGLLVSPGQQVAASLQ